MEKRFSQVDLQIVHSLETLLLKASNGIIVEPEEILLQYLEKDINKERFIAQLSMLQDMIQNAQQNSIKKVTSLQTIADSMNKSDIYKRMLGEIDKVLKVYFTVPVTTATAERSFSALRRLKTFASRAASPITYKDEFEINYNIKWLIAATSRTTQSFVTAHNSGTQIW